jgi:nucleotide-binding universal stress UspA family protein
MEADTPRDGFPRRKRLIALTQPKRNARAKCSMRSAEQIGISGELLHVPNSHAATAIIDTAKSRGCDLIVMASHGRRGLRKLFLGSQTSEVLADGSVPVLVVR